MKKKEYSIDLVGGYVQIEDVNTFMQNIETFSSHHDIIIQVLNAKMVCGKNHLYSAAFHAYRAAKEHTQTTHSVSMEIILYASGERQIKLALEKMGVSKGKNQIAIVFLDLLKRDNTYMEQSIKKLLKDMMIKRDDSLLSASIEKVKNFGITKKERETVSKQNYHHLVLERIALVDIIK